MMKKIIGTACMVAFTAVTAMEVPEVVLETTDLNAAQITYSTGNLTFKTLTAETQESAKDIINTYNTSEEERLGANAINIGNITANQLVRISRGNFWHAVTASNNSGEVVGVIAFGAMPTITYTALEHQPLHDAFREMNLVTDDIVDGKHVAVDEKGLGTFVWALKTSDQNANEFLRGAVDIARRFKDEAKPLPLTGFQADKLFILLPRGDDEMKALFEVNGFIADENDAWDLLYPPKTRIAMLLDL